MKKSICSIALLFVMLSLPAYAADFDFFGNIQFHNDVLSWQVTTGAATVTVFTSSWDDGNFDPILQVWGPDGTLLYQQDDGGVAGITLSNGVPYGHGSWDTYYSLPVSEGTYTLTMSTYANFARGTNLSNPLFDYQNDTPIPIGSWNQPANGIRGSYYEVHFLGAAEVIPDGNPVPEPTTLVLLGSGLGVIGLAAWRKRR